MLPAGFSVRACYQFTCTCTSAVRAQTLTYVNFADRAVRQMVVAPWSHADHPANPCGALLHPACRPFLKSTLRRQSLVPPPAHSARGSTGHDALHPLHCCVASLPAPASCSREYVGTAGLHTLRLWPQTRCASMHFDTGIAVCAAMVQPVRQPPCTGGIQSVLRRKRSPWVALRSGRAVGSQQGWVAEEAHLRRLIPGHCLSPLLGRTGRPDLARERSSPTPLHPARAASRR